MKNSKDPKNITFKVLDLEAGLNGLGSKAGEGFPLENWYRAMQDIPIKDFGIEDICRASRQRVHLDYVVPVALKMLGNDPLAGELYAGELISSLKAVPADFWSTHPSDKELLKRIFTENFRMADMPTDALDDARHLIQSAGLSDFVKT